MSNEMGHSLKLKIFASMFWRDEAEQDGDGVSEAAKLFVKFHDRVDQVQAMWSDKDLARGFSLPKDVTEDFRARRFLFALADIDFFNLGVKPDLFKTRLRKKHVITSLIGTHCIFSLHDINGIEVDGISYMVHLDSEKNIVMAINIYEQEGTSNFLKKDSEEMGEDNINWSIVDILRRLADTFRFQIERLPFTSELDDLSVDEKRAVKTAINTYNQAGQEQGKIQSVTIKGRLISLLSASPINCLQVKVSTDQGSFEWRVDKQGNILEPVLSNGPGVRLGYIFDDHWRDDIEQLDKKRTRRVILRELTRIQGELSGPYVKVTDAINFNWSQEGQHLMLATDNSAFDRVMAYYHLDQIQRYFRNLDLEALADYQELNPVQAILTADRAKSGSYYNTNEKVIYVRNLKDSPDNFTEARDSRVIHHEFVHVVTDALARLHRQNENNESNSRRVDLIQAMAMDEGLADYFACRVAQNFRPNQPPHFGLLSLKDPDFNEFIFVVERKLDNDFKLEPLMRFTIEDLENELKTKAVITIKYEWGQHWGCYLWHLSLDTNLGHIADKVIAHSILFLTRWSGFDMGIVALIMADQLLFGQNNHHDKIVNNTPLATITAIDINNLSDEVPSKPGIVEITFTSLSALQEQIKVMTV